MLKKTRAMGWESQGVRGNFSWEGFSEKVTLELTPK